MNELKGDSMKKEIKITKLVKELSNLSNDKKVEYIKKNIKSESYISWNTKVSLANNIVRSTSYRLEKKQDGNYSPTNVIKVDSNNRFVLFIIKVIDTWTNIELSNNIAEDFDNLNSLGIVDIIMNPEYEIIPTRELKEFNTICENCFSDIITNEYELHTFITNQIIRISDIINIFLQPLTKKIETMNDEDFKKFVNKFDIFFDKAKLIMK